MPRQIGFILVAAPVLIHSPYPVPVQSFVTHKYEYINSFRESKIHLTRNHRGRIRSKHIDWDDQQRLSVPQSSGIMKSNESDPLLFDDRESGSQSLEICAPDLPRTSTTPPPDTTGQRILQLAIPAAGALLIDPLMTLADTAFVGRYSETPDPLAGMGSAAPLLTFSFYLFNFLCTATTPLVASQRAAGNEKQAVALGGQVLSLALALGGVLTLVLLAAKQPLLTIMGTGITGASANENALIFLSIRALAAPAVLCMEASTGILRGYLDTRTPIVVLIVANALNLVLDVILIVFAGMGPMGAAIATTTAEWISALLFLGVLAGRLPSASGELGWRGDGAPIISVKPVLAIPPWDEVRPLVVASASVFSRAIILQFSLSGAAAMAARGGEPTAAVAAHQIGIQLWLLCSYFCDSLAAASQGLVADALGRRDLVDAREISKTVFLYSTVLGFSLGAFLQLGESSGILFEVFANNEAIRFALRNILPVIVFAQPLNALVFSADGVLQGASEFPYQARSMALSSTCALTTFLLLQKLSNEADTLIHVWIALLILQFMRFVTSLWKLTDKDGPIDLMA